MRWSCVSTCCTRHFKTNKRWHLFSFQQKSFENYVASCTRKLAITCQFILHVQPNDNSWRHFFLNQLEISKNLKFKSKIILTILERLKKNTMFRYQPKHDFAQHNQDKKEKYVSFFYYYFCNIFAGCTTFY